MSQPPASQPSAPTSLNLSNTTAVAIVNNVGSVRKKKRHPKIDTLANGRALSYDCPTDEDDDHEGREVLFHETTISIDKDSSDDERVSEPLLPPISSIDNQNNKQTTTDDEEFSDYITPQMNYKESTGSSATAAASCRSPPIITIRDASRNSFAGERDDISLYGTPKEEPGPMFGEAKASFMRNQIEALFQPSDNKLAMKLFGSKKALMKERVRQRESGHWIIHPCSNFR